MTDFGRRFGDMLKSTYDTDENGVVDNSESTANHASKHQSGGSDEIDCTGLAGRVNMVGRGCPPVLTDFDQTDLEFTSGWHTLDMSSVVPAGAKFVWFLVNMVSPAAGRYFIAKCPDDNCDWNHDAMFAHVASTPYRRTFMVKLNTAREINYMVHQSGFSTFDITVRAWLI